MTTAVAKVKLDLDPDWLKGLDKQLNELRDMVAALAEEHILIADEFMPLTEKVKDLFSHLDVAMIACDPETMPDEENFRPADARKVGANHPPKG